MTGTREGKGYEELTSWANDQDHWLRGVVAEVVETHRPLGEERVDVYYQALLREKDLEEGDVVKIPTVDVTPGALPGEPPLKLVSLSDVENVNALKTGQRIEFNPRLTVLFGENGAGKTGYVRVLKMVGAVRTAEAILPDVRDSDGADQTPKATIRYRLGDEEPSSVAWEGERGVRHLVRVDAFDSASVDVHVDGQLEFVYTPGEVAVFGYVHECIKSVKALLDASTKEKRPKGNPFLERVSREGAFYNTIETLGEATDLAPLELAARITDEEVAAKSKLEEQVRALSPGGAAAKLEVARTEKELWERIGDNVRLGVEFQSDDYSTKRSAVASARDAEKAWSESLLREVPIPGVGKELWRAFVEAGDSYIEAEVDSHYPKEGSQCVYCLQPLESAAIELVGKFRKYVRGEKRAAVRAAEGELAAVRERLDGLDTGRLESDLARKLETALDAKKEPLEKAADCVRLLAALHQSVKAGEDISESVDKARLAEVVQVAGEYTQTNTELVASLESQVKEREALLKEAEDNLRELNDRVALRELLPRIRQRVVDAKWASKSATIASRLKSTEKALTNLMKTVSAELLNDDFQAAFSAECEALRAPPVTLKFPGKDAQPARAKSLAAKVGLRKVLSEGEQKVIALADFLAEADLRKSSAPIVFDDPVTSLDYRRVDHVVKRILELSTTRQVVVFTHNIMFTMKLLEPFEKKRAQVSYFDVRDEEGERGIVSPGECPQVDTWKERSKRMKERIAWAKDEKVFEKRKLFVVSGYDTLRGACELVVEEFMLKKVVQSYRPNVMVGKLTELDLDKLQAERAKLAELFHKCCRITEAHKQPEETRNVVTKLEDLESDWESLKAIQKQFG